jgi:DNA-binding MarR family transcriptional regulator
MVEERERIIREVIKVLPELAKSLNRDAALHVAAGRAKPGQASAAQIRTLVHLAQYGPQTMGELAEGMQITTASATGLIKPLAAMGYVTRSRDPQDQRVVRVELSARAKATADQILAERRGEVEVALAGMDDRACRDFLEGLERLVGRRR